MLIPATPAPQQTNIAEIPASPLAIGVSEIFLQRESAELARRIVAGIDDPMQLAIAMGLSSVQWQVLQSHPHFQRQIAQAKTDANSPTGLVDQVRLKALVALNEGGILDMVQIMANVDSAPNVRKGAFDSLADVAGITRHKDQQASQVGSGPLVTITMSGGQGAISIGSGEP